MRQGITKGKHPGGEKLTSLMLSKCEMIQGSWLDIGCGRGDTVELLRDKYGVKAIGLDADDKAFPEAKEKLYNFVCADAHSLPFSDQSMDGILMECCLSLMEEMDIVLRECRRVLKRDGFLLVSDMYARARSVRIDSLRCNLYTEYEIMRRMKGFSLICFEDKSLALQELVGQMILESGTEAVYGDPVERESTQKAKAGYYMLVATKREP